MQDSMDSNVNLSCFVPSYSTIVGKGFLQSSWKYYHQACGILTDLEPLFLVFSGQLGVELETSEIKG